MNPDIKSLIDYTDHNLDCIRRHWSGGRPTNNGGYESCYNGKWYENKPIDKTPKCECGLDELIVRITNG